MKEIKVNNLGELFTEFKKYRAEKSNVAKKENFNKYVGSGLGLFQQKVVGDKIKAQLLWLTRIDGNKKVIEKELVLDLPNLTDEEWEPYGKKVFLVLQEIWETGEMKNNQGLDLNWPVASKEDKPKQNSDPSSTSSTDKGNKIGWWIGGGIIFILSILFLVYLFGKRKKVKK